MEVFPESAIAAHVKDESKRVVSSRVDSEESNNVGVRELRKHPCLADESLRQNVSHAVREESSFLTRDILSTSPVS